MILKKLKLIGFAALALSFSVPALWAGTATIDATVTNQYIHGFGAASAWNAASNLSSWASTLWANDNVNGHVGLSLLRTRIDPTDTGSGAAWNSEAGPMTLAKSVNPNIIIWSTEWSPPATYKNNNSVNGGGSNGALNSTATFKGAATGAPNASDTGYAAYLVRYIQYIQSKFGVSLYAVSCQNEPDWDPTYEAAIWSAGQFDVFVPCFGASITGAGLPTKIMVTESFGDRLPLVATTMGDAGAAPFVSIVAGHIYGGGPNSIPTSYSTTAGHTVENWETEMSDVSGAGFDASITSGLQEASWVHNCMTTGNMDAFLHWWIYGTDNSALIAASGTSKKLMVLGNYSKFVRPGFYRMGATTVPSTGVSVTAYKDTNTSSPATVVIVAINGNGSTTSQTFTFNGVTVTSVIPWVTDASNDLVQKAAVAVTGNSFTYSLTGPSVTTFVGLVSGGGGPTYTPTVTPTPVVQSTWRVNAGGPAYTDGAGHVWAADENYSAGSTVASGGTITGTSDSTLYDTQRYGASFSYSFNVPAGSYQVTLKFAETYSGDDSTGARIFSVALNGTTVTPNLDIYSQVGANTADDQVYNNVSPSGGVITIQFTATTGTDLNAVLEALQIIPMPATPTLTATVTRTTTATATRTATLTTTPTRTPTLTLTMTSTKTPTVTLTATPTRTSSPTATSSPSATSSPTGTSQFTPTVTLSPTGTVTRTETSTVTSSFTSTATKTVTNTLTPTASPTGTSTPSVTKTFTVTLTPQFTYTQTLSPTVSDTPTITPTASASATPSLTSTASATRTSTASMTPTASRTLSPTGTATLTASPTKTVTPLFTPTTTPTFTSTRTQTPTFTPSLTATPTSQPTVSLQLSSSVSSVEPGQSYTYKLQILVSGSGARNSNLVLNLPSGVVVTGFTQGPSGSVNGGQVSWDLSNLPIGTTELQLTVEVSTSASGNLDSQATLNYTGGSISSNSSSVTLVVLTATLTPTPAPVITATPTPALATGTPVIFPNPVTGGTTTGIQLPNYPGTEEVTIQVFTTAFRRVSWSKDSYAGGSVVTLPLSDNWGHPLADGLYYVVVESPVGKSILKLLVLR